MQFMLWANCEKLITKAKLSRENVSIVNCTLLRGDRRCWPILQIQSWGDSHQVSTSRSSHLSGIKSFNVFLAGKRQRDLSSRPPSHLSSYGEKKGEHKFSSTAFHYSALWTLLTLIGANQHHLNNLWRDGETENWNSRRSNQLKCISGDINQKSAFVSGINKLNNLKPASREPENMSQFYDCNVPATNCCIFLDNIKSDKFFVAI